MSLTIPSDYAYPLLVAALMNIQCVFTGFAVTPLRSKLNVPYPDMGTGRHASKLNDTDHELFNNYQRAHYNYVEQFGPAQSALLISGVFYPRLAAVLGGLYVVGRHFYARGYRKYGPKGRMPAVLVVDVGLVGLFGASVYGVASTIYQHWV